MVDVLIIGAGGAGLSCAIEAKQIGLDVLVISKTHPLRSQTVQAQGGINAVLDKDDSVSSFVSDTQKSSCGLGALQNIEFLCAKSGSAIEWLTSFGVAFSIDDHSDIAQRRLGGASHKRASYCQDYTGLKILHTLYEQSIKNDINMLCDKQLLNLIVQDDVVVGATFYDIKSCMVEEYYAKSVVIATGGYSGLYRGFTTNSYASSGDGIASALRAGAKVSNLEFVQFHPTALKNSSILISESARGEGGYLVNSDSQRFVDELAPRDKVARAIYEQIESGKDVYIDIRHLGKDTISTLLPQERKLAITHEGVDPVDSLVPIKPVAHYSMGGIDVDIECKSSLSGLYAIGECSNVQVHGANRLGGNSLLEIVVFGRQCANSVKKYVSDIANIQPAQNSTQYNDDKKFVEACFKFPNKINFYERREFLGKILYRNCGIIRNEKNLKAVLQTIRQYQAEYHFMGIADKSRVYNTNLLEFLEFGNMLELAEAMTIGAINRCESRGAHFRQEYPSTNDDFLANTIYTKNMGALSASFAKVY